MAIRKPDSRREGAKNVAGFGPGFAPAEQGSTHLHLPYQRPEAPPLFRGGRPGLGFTEGRLGEFETSLVTALLVTVFLVALSRLSVMARSLPPVQPEKPRPVEHVAAVVAVGGVEVAVAAVAQGSEHVAGAAVVGGQRGAQ